VQNHAAACRRQQPSFLLYRLGMERRQLPDRRRVTRSGRRATDPHDMTVITLRQQLERLDALIQRLVDEIQVLTATLRKP